MKTRILFVALNVIITFSANTQNISDVVRWSTVDQFGTARTLGVGGAFGAMGGDYSSIAINPAGIGDFRISEFTFTPTLKKHETEAYFLNDRSNIANLTGSNLGLDQIGFVFASKGKTWTSSNFAIGYNRVKDLRRNVFINGNIQGSITRYFAEKANGISVNDLDEFIAYPAYYTGAIIKDENSNTYSTDFDNFLDTPVYRAQEMTQKGGVNEFSFGWAGEYKRKFNLGLSVGVPLANFEEFKTYKEIDINNEIDYFDNLRYDESLNTSGVGINIKGGIVYKPSQNLRIGGSFFSPTWYRFTDDFYTDMNYQYSDLGGTSNLSYASKEGTFEYKITTPWRAIGSLGYIFRTGDILGFINGDIEYVDYRSAVYNGVAFLNNASEQRWTRIVNNAIQTSLTSVTNYRLGGEIGYKSLRLRAGYNWERSPFLNEKVSNNAIAFGLGIREDKFFIDLGIRRSEFSEGYNPYVIVDKNYDPTTNIKNNRNRINLTLGFKF